MNKRIKFLICAVLIFAIFVSTFIIPASSFENDVETSTSDIMLINLDTDTIVFSKNPDTNWYAGMLAELMTFLLVYEMIPDPDHTTFEVEQSYISSLPFTDGCLDKFVGKTLTATDLMAIMLLTSGNDAAYALADLASNNDREAFVSAMNDRVVQLGMKSTAYVSPGFNNTSAQHTTCRDLAKLYTKVRENAFYRNVMKAQAYTPAGLDETYKVTIQPSIMNENSPYYFKYVTDAKYSYTEDTYELMAATTTYHGMTYLFVGLLGLHQSEYNIYGDARKLTTWAYLNLSDRKIFDEGKELSDITVTTDWGQYQVALYAENAAYRTLPNDYDEKNLTYTFDLPESVKTPLVQGQSVGRTQIFYDGEKVDEIPLSVKRDEGLGMLYDIARYSGNVFKEVLPDVAPSGTEPVSVTGSESTEKSATEAVPAATTAATEG